MSMFPIILGALAIIGLAIRDPATEVKFQLLVINVFPASAQPELQHALQGVKASSGWLAIVSIAGLVWSASSIFSTMEFALTQIFGTRQRDMLRQRLMGLIMMVVLVLAIVATVGANAVAAFVPGVGALFGFVFGSVVMVWLLVAMYRFVPNRTFRVRDVVPGAVLSGVLVEILSFAFPLYARFAGGFNTYGAQFALFFLLATWFYLLSQLILLGAVFNKFRLGEPTAKGIVAAPLRESREKVPPVEAIEQNKAAETPPAAARQSIFQRR
jgi:membrane protein